MWKHQKMIAKNQEASIKNVERQIGQLSKQFATEKPSSSLPSDTIPNSKEECKAVQLRSGRTLISINDTTKKPVESSKGPIGKEKSTDTEKTNDQDVMPNKNTEKQKKKEDKPTNSQEREEKLIQGQQQKEKAFTPSLPYPQRFNKETKDQHFHKFLETFKKLEINIPMAEALEQMPLYAKFLKDLINKKRSWSEKETVLLTEECSAVLQKGIPLKLKDPGSFVVSCTIGKMTLDKALCDLGASINLMPLSMMRKLAIKKLKPTRMSLVMADRSIKTPNGIVENLLVKVGEFIFPVDFVILDTEEEGNNSIILGRPFLATVRAIIDVEKGEMIFRVHNEQMVINVFKSIQHPPEQENYMKVDMIESLVEETLEATSHEQQDEEVEEEQEEEVVEISREDKEKEKPKQELKPLPSHLKYVFLGEEETLPLIINSSLNMEEKTRLIEVLKAHKAALGWTIDDIKGISPAICMHKILLEEESKPVVQPQRRLNPAMKEVVQKEVMKLWNAGIIFPISDSSWGEPGSSCTKKKRNDGHHQ
ncbi:uncharacterized protein LOC130963057 [Arachis stenosperma]|uniref:uncharacterized protein LOC130963057 n=1 Tax=Arachis stenosperma TaxID=217475 RepID=UPI0025AC2E84|nr:uncharacterized protein LOC130963057 [Arachis stenosperma]